MEKCVRCKKKFGLIWQIDDDIWKKVQGENNDNLCANCFDEMARQKGIELYWEATEKEYPIKKLRKNFDKFIINLSKELK